VGAPGYSKASGSCPQTKFKAELEAQMKDNAFRKVVMPMTEVEKKLNSLLLRDIAQHNTVKLAGGRTTAGH
jgi:hypothetical protein